MRRNTNGRGELLNFLKGETHKGIDWTKDAQVSQVRQTLGGKKNLAVHQVSYQLSGLDDNITDPIVVEGDGRRYTFKNVIPKSRDEAVAETLEIEQL